MTCTDHEAVCYVITSVAHFLRRGDWVHFVRQPWIGLLYQYQMIDDECGAVGGMRIGRRNRNTRRKPAPVPLDPPQIPHDLTWARTQSAVVGSRRLTAWAMAPPSYSLSLLRSDTFLRTLFSDTCILCFCMKVRDHVSHPYKKFANFVLYIMICVLCTNLYRPNSQGRQHPFSVL
jgi:hypothetical protein